MKTYAAVLSYTEEDGFEIQHGNNSYRVYGTCEGNYICHVYPGDENEPASTYAECIEHNCWVDSIYDDYGSEVDITLTDEEFAEFEDYMLTNLDDVAGNHDFSEDYFEGYNLIEDEED